MEITKQQKAEIINLCYDLLSLNTKGQRGESIQVGPGRIANYQDIANRLLEALEATNS